MIFVFTVFDADELIDSIFTADVNAYLPLPRLEAQNATAIAITFTETPYLPPKDNWTFGDAYILSIYKSSDAVASATIRVFEFSGAIPTTYYVNGLEIYTSYTVNSTYVGKLNGVTEFNIGAGSDRIKTGEGGKLATKLCILTFKKPAKLKRPSELCCQCEHPSC